jgi:multicomponent K+:H+ antiporter subunit G
MPPISEAIVALLLLASGCIALIAALGLVRLPTFFDRMHAPALVQTLAAWCVTFASIIHFSTRAGEPRLHIWLIIIILSITVPVTTAVLARATLFRERQEPGSNLPPPLRKQMPATRPDQPPAP